MSKELHDKRKQLWNRVALLEMQEKHYLRISEAPDSEAFERQSARIELNKVRFNLIGLRDQIKQLGG